MWRVVFDEQNSVCVSANDSFEASIIGRFQAWMVTRQWLTVKRVELIDGDSKS
jgi:hypothetical protein